MNLDKSGNCPFCLTWGGTCMFKRQKYLEQLIALRDNGQVKVITGLRRVGKSYLLRNIYLHYLLESGVSENRILFLPLDNIEFAKYRSPQALYEGVLSLIKDKESMNYVFIDEIRYCKETDNPDVEGDKLTFYDVCNSLKDKPFIDLYVTGSNSHMLSSDVMTEFRGRGEEINVRPLSYREILLETDVEEGRCYEEYSIYGGLPLVVNKKSHEEKAKILNELRIETYLKDIVERNGIADDEALNRLGRIFSTITGSLNNIQKLADTFSSTYGKKISWETVNKYVKAYKDSFILEEAERYDLVGRKNLEGPHKYYFTDNGIFNSFSDFSHIEVQKLLENTIYNELLYRGFSVEVGLIKKRERKGGESQYIDYEIDFIASKYNKKYYIQVATSLDDPEKEEQEKRPLILSKDFFKKVVIVKDDIIARKDERGILTLGVKEFLKNEAALDL